MPGGREGATRVFSLMQLQRTVVPVSNKSLHMPTFLS